MPRAPIDLHAHTNVSDGTLAPRALVRLAKARGLAALAVTDHDHVGALPDARDEGRLLGVEVVTGIELSVAHEGLDVHLLGYLFDDEDPTLRARLDALREGRAARAERMVEKLRALGVDVTPEDVRREAGAGASVGRPHVARALMRRGMVASLQEAFERYLADGGPAYVPKEKLTIEEALALLHGAGGVASLAHPVTLPVDRREEVVRALAQKGLDALEVDHSKHSDEDEATFRRWAEALDLVPTGGSDFHGDNKPLVELGSGVGGNVAVDAATLEALRTRASRWRRG